MTKLLFCDLSTSQLLFIVQVVDFEKHQLERKAIKIVYIRNIDVVIANVISKNICETFYQKIVKISKMMTVTY